MPRSKPPLEPIEGDLLTESEPTDSAFPEWATAEVSKEGATPEPVSSAYDLRPVALIAAVLLLAGAAFLVN